MRQRAKPRVNVKFPVQFLGDSSLGKGSLVNLSAPGCAVHSTTPLKAGSYVSLQIKLPRHSKPLVVAVALVRWVKGSQFGLEFIRYGCGGKARLDHLLSMKQGECSLVQTANDDQWVG